MNSLSMNNKKDVSRLLVLTMLLSCWLAVPIPAKAGILQTAGSILKTVTVTAGSLAAGAMGGVLGIAVGGGPIGMVAGAVGGFIVGKKIMNWATASFANVATVLGAVGGGLLVVGMGAPMLAVGVIGGALLGRGIAALFKKITGNDTTLVAVADDGKTQDFINHILPTNAAAAVVPEATPAPVTVTPVATDPSQDSYNRYLTAYKAYLEASQNGDSAAAQKCFGDYQKYLAEYQASTKKK
ncbi:MAG: hypothetical protein WA705_25315 [Candidatus Ozemobacteraceae bacterium]